MYHKSDIFIAIFIFLICFFIYNATLAPELNYKSPDSNELIVVSYTLGLAHSTGYPLYTWLGKLFTFIPIGSIAYRLNMMSAVLGALSIAIFFLVLRLISKDSKYVAASYVAPVFASLLIAFSKTFWSQTGIAEVYTPNAFMFLLTLLILLIWAKHVTSYNFQAFISFSSKAVRFLLKHARPLLFIFGLCLGLSLGTHMSNLGFIPAFLLFILLINWRIALNPVSIMYGGIGFCMGLLQFLWLPYKANTLNENLIIGIPPKTLEGIYNYTLNAFPNFKFDFPITAIPDRIVVYLDLLQQQFGIAGIAAGIIGMFTLLWEKPKYFFLIVGMYLVHLWFFIQYDVYDLDVFFIPAHMLYSVFIGYGIYWLIKEVLIWFRKRQSIYSLLTIGILILILSMSVINEIVSNWKKNNYSKETAINDFYQNVFQLLPQNSVLFGRRGVLGYDIFYYRLVYNMRPDVLIPQIEESEIDLDTLDKREIYTNTYSEYYIDNRFQQHLYPEDSGDNNSFCIPVLFGNIPKFNFGGINSLVLYHIVDELSGIIIENPKPQTMAGEEIGGWILLGYDIESKEVKAGSMLHLTFYWQPSEKLQQVLISTNLGDTVLETHPMSLGNLQNFLIENELAYNHAGVEDYSIVIPGTTEPGLMNLNVSFKVPSRNYESRAEWISPLNLGYIMIIQGE